MKNLHSLLFVPFVSFCLNSSGAINAPVPLMVQTNGALITGSAGGTSNFFVVNSNWLNQSVSATGSGLATSAQLGATGAANTNFTLAASNALAAATASQGTSVTNVMATLQHGSTTLSNFAATAIEDTAGDVTFPGSVFAVAVFANGNGLSDLNAASLSGTVPYANLPSALLTNNNAGATVIKNNLSASNFTVTASATVNTNLNVGGTLTATNVIDGGQNQIALTANGGISLVNQYSYNVNANSYNSGITLDDNGDVDIQGNAFFTNGANFLQGLSIPAGGFAYSQTQAGERFAITAFQNAISQETFDIFSPSGVNFSNDQFVVWGASNWYGVVVGPMGGLQASKTWTGFTNVSGLSAYTADIADRYILCNPSAASCVVTLPGLGHFGETTQTKPAWTFVRDGATKGPAFSSLDWTIENLGSNTANTLTVQLADSAQFTNNPGGSILTLPNQMGARLTSNGTNVLAQFFATTTNLPAADANALATASNNITTAYTAAIAAVAGGTSVGSSVAALVNGTRFYLPGGGGSASSTGAQFNDFLSTRAGALSTLRLHLSSAPLVNTNITATVEVNDSDSAVTCTLTGDTTTTTASDLTHSVAISAGDKICLKIVGNSAFNQTVSWSFIVP